MPLDKKRKSSFVSSTPTEKKEKKNSKDAEAEKPKKKAKPMKSIDVDFDVQDSDGSNAGVMKAKGKPKKPKKSVNTGFDVPVPDIDDTDVKKAKGKPKKQNKSNPVFDDVDAKKASSKNPKKSVRDDDLIYSDSDDDTSAKKAKQSPKKPKKTGKADDDDNAYTRKAIESPTKPNKSTKATIDKVNSNDKNVAGAKKVKASPKKSITSTKADLDAVDSEEDDAGVSQVNNSKGEPELWPPEDLLELLHRMEEIVPKEDTSFHKSRVENLKWNKVAFKIYNASQCREMWESITRKLRGYRILQELIDDAKGWVERPWTNFYRGVKLNRHPELPTRPLTSYMLYYMDTKDKVKQENPKMDMTHLTKHIAELYKALPEAQLNKYKEKAQNLKTLYEKEMEEFNNKHPEQAKKATKLDRSKCSSSSLLMQPPIRPLTPFKFYCEENMEKYRSSNPNFNKTKYIESCKEQWKNLDTDKKGIWIKWVLEKEEAYNKELEMYMEENPSYVHKQHTKTVLTKEELQIIEKLSGKPQKPPNSGYSLYSQKLLASDAMKHVNTKDRMVAIGQQWTRCGSAEKEEYREQVKHLNDTYKLEYAAYLQSLPKDKRDKELSKKLTTKRGSKSAKLDDTDGIIPKKRAKKEKKSIDSKPNSDLFKGEPASPPVQAALLFAETFNGSVEEAQQVWKTLSRAKQDKFHKKLQDLKQKYIVQYEEFLKKLTPDELKEYTVLVKTRPKHNMNSDMEESESSSSEEEEEEQEEEEEEAEKENNDSLKSSSGSDSDESTADVGFNIRKSLNAPNNNITSNQVYSSSSSESEDDSD